MEQNSIKKITSSLPLGVTTGVNLSSTSTGALDMVLRKKANKRARGKEESVVVYCIHGGIRCYAFLCRALSLPLFFSLSIALIFPSYTSKGHTYRRSHAYITWIARLSSRDFFTKNYLITTVMLLENSCPIIE